MEDSHPHLAFSGIAKPELRGGMNQLARQMMRSTRDKGAWSGYADRAPPGAVR
jgi:hypothetical protein